MGRTIRAGVVGFGLGGQIFHAPFLKAMDGFELAAALRENPGTATIPVIALSAMVSADAIERGRSVGFHDFVAKFDRPGLIAALKEQSDDLHEAA